MTDWTRNDSIRLGQIAQQVGLLPNEAEEALTLGARFYAYGFTGSEIDEMIRWQYRNWAEEELGRPITGQDVIQTRREMGFL